MSTPSSRVTLESSDVKAVLTTPVVKVAAKAIADLDPTGIAAGILEIVFTIDEQYEQMRANKEACKDLHKQVMLVSGVVCKLIEERQQIKEISCKQTLETLRTCLTECKDIIKSVAQRSKTSGFVLSEQDKGQIAGLKEKLDRTINISQFGLIAKIYEDIKEDIGEDSDTAGIIKATYDKLKASSDATYDQLNALQQRADATHQDVIAISERIMAVQQQTSHSASPQQPVLREIEVDVHISERTHYDVEEMLDIAENEGDDNRQPLTPKQQLRQKQDEEMAKDFLGAVVTTADSTKYVKKVTASSATDTVTGGRVAKVATSDPSERAAMLSNFFSKKKSTNRSSSSSSPSPSADKKEEPSSSTSSEAAYELQERPRRPSNPKS